MGARGINFPPEETTHKGHPHLRHHFPTVQRIFLTVRCRNINYSKRFSNETNEPITRVMFNLNWKVSYSTWRTYREGILTSTSNFCCVYIRSHIFVSPPLEPSHYTRKQLHRELERKQTVRLSYLRGETSRHVIVHSWLGPSEIQLRRIRPNTVTDKRQHEVSLDAPYLMFEFNILYDSGLSK